jgi:purine-binding chemotaxis protein CheW
MNTVGSVKGEKTSAALEHQLVTFVIGTEVYGVDVAAVQEIIGITHITHIPNSLPFMKGVINLRGSVVPVIDMRLKFNIDEKAYDSSTVIIIVEVHNRLIGMIVDAVSDVVNVSSATIQDTPHFTSKIETDFISGIGQVEGGLVIILDVDLIMTREDVLTVEAS